jgi:hypothetical protein
MQVCTPRCGGDVDCTVVILMVVVVVMLMAESLQQSQVTLWYIPQYRLASFAVSGMTLMFVVVAVVIMVMVASVSVVMDTVMV